MEILGRHHEERTARRNHEAEKIAASKIGKKYKVLSRLSMSCKEPAEPPSYSHSNHRVLPGFDKKHPALDPPFPPIGHSTQTSPKQQVTSQLKFSGTVEPRVQVNDKKKKSICLDYLGMCLFPR